MARSSMTIGCLLVCCCLAAGVLGEQGVKGVHHHPTQYYSQPTNDTGYCYKRVPYNPRSQYNTSGSYSETGHNAYDYRNNAHGYITVLDCCDGYERNPSTNRCESLSSHLTSCEDNCFGGTCRQGVCTCEPGWSVSEGSCRPVCRRPCSENAYCFSPDVCECKFGWERSRYGECNPICPGGCVNGDCIAPRVCRCHPGFVLDEARQRCQPVCEGGCRHGQCAAPGQCQCDPGWTNPPGDRETCVEECTPGYVRETYHGNCIPECRRACPYDAHCTAPDTCTCRSGYEIEQRSNRCVASGSYQTGHQQTNRPQNENAHCDRPCINGVCMGYNICSCNDGYLPDPLDSSRTRCLPTCVGGCHNGVCSAPNRCICNPGYVKERAVKGSQRCVPHYNY